jgi:hypothetical protein
MTCPLVDFLQSDDAALVESTIALLSLICEKSSYARDSILCLEIHTTLIQIGSVPWPRHEATEPRAAARTVPLRRPIHMGLRQQVNLGYYFRVGEQNSRTGSIPIFLATARG